MCVCVRVCNSQKYQLASDTDNPQSAPAALSCRPAEAFEQDCARATYINKNVSTCSENEKHIFIKQSYHFCSFHCTGDTKNLLAERNKKYHYRSTMKYFNQQIQINFNKKKAITYALLVYRYPHRNGVCFYAPLIYI